VQSFRKQRWYILRADANALGGYLREPVEKSIPTLAPVSLPAVGGFSTARSEAFELDEIVSCSAAYTRVSGQEHANGSSSILVTAVVENLNILEVVRAERVVAQVSIFLPGEPAPIEISTAGSTFEGLYLAGQKCLPKFNEDLQGSGGGQGLTWEKVAPVGLAQDKTLIEACKDGAKETQEWVASRHKSLAPAAPAVASYASASLVDSLGVAGGNRCYGHIVDIPQFGRIILGELLLSRDAVQLVAIRAELGCPVSGRISTNAVGGGGLGEN
jgi:hypothetical protein